MTEDKDKERRNIRGIKVKSKEKAKEGGIRKKNIPEEKERREELTRKDLTDNAKRERMNE